MIPTITSSGRVFSPDIDKENFFIEKRMIIDDFYREIPSILAQSDGSEKGTMKLAEQNLCSKIKFDGKIKEYKDLILFRVLEAWIAKSGT